MSHDSNSTITDATGDTSIAEPLEAGVTDVWEDTLPSGTHSTLVLEAKQFVLAIPEDNAIFLQVGGRWGPAKGNIALYVRHPQEQPLNFALVASVSSLGSADIFEDVELANEIRDQLPGPSGDVCVLREWPGIGKAEVQELALSQPKASHALDVLKGVNTLLSPTPASKQTGIVVMVKLKLSDWSSSPAATLLKRLSDIDRLAGNSAITTLSVGCAVDKSSDPEPLTSLTFLAAVDALPIFDKALLKDISLSLTIALSDSASPPNALLKLTGQLVLGVFNTQNPWTSVGTLTIDKAKQVAELVVAPANHEQSMAELGVIKLGDINLRVAYTFGQPEVKCDVSLSAVVKIGDCSVKGAFVFEGSRPSHLLFAMPGTLQVGGLIRYILGDGFPEDFIKLSFSDIKFCYSWNVEKVSVGPESTVEPGLTAIARANVFGFKFQALIKFTPCGKDKGVFVTARLEQPVDLFILSLYGRDNDTSVGPQITYTTKKSDANGLTIDCGLRLLKDHMGDFKIRSGERSTENKEPCLQVDIAIVDPILPGGRADVNLEFFKVKGKTHFRLNGLPLSEIYGIYKEADLLSKIRDLTSADPCKEINIPVKDALTMGIWPKIEFSMEQPKQEAGKVPRCSFEVSCVCSIKLTDETIVKFDLEPFTLVIRAPKEWRDVWKEIAIALGTALDKRVLSFTLKVSHGSLNASSPTSRRSIILAFYVGRYMAEKWMKEALRAWLCRHSDALVPTPDIDDVAPAPVPLPKPITGSEQNDNGDEITLPAPVPLPQPITGSTQNDNGHEVTAPVLLPRPATGPKRNDNGDGVILPAPVPLPEPITGSTRDDNGDEVTLPAPVPLPQPIKSKWNKNGDEVTLTERFQELILKLRTEAPDTIECLEAILQMLGEGDPTKAKPNIPVISVPSGEKTGYTKRTRLLLSAFERIRDRDWDSTTWNEDYDLIMKPFGREWRMDLWDGLHEIKLHVGTLAKAYEVEVFRKIHSLNSHLMDLIGEATNVNESQLPFALKALRVLGEICSDVAHDRVFAMGLGGNTGSVPSGKASSLSSLNTTASSIGP